jgi:photosystem II stability/assembly factor-like uncharacterized protein
MRTKPTPRALTLVAVATLAAGSALLAPSSAQAGAGHRSPASAKATTSWSWAPSATGSTSRFRGLAAVNGRTAWVAGSDATILRTTDGGASWQDVSPPADQTQASAGLLLFRDIEATDSRHAVALAIGSGTDSRILVTSNGGRTWTTTFTNQDPNAFYDCMGFFDRRHGLAVSDPVDGKFRVLSTADAGRHWRVMSTKGMPPALDGEFGFAASGTCLVTAGAHDAWIASGGGASSRVFHTTDRGRHWSVASTPIASGASAGIFSLAVRGTQDLVAVGGDFLTPDAAVDAAGRSTDAGQTWRLSATMPGGYRSGAAWVAHTHATLIAVGPTGSDVSTNAGRDWTGFDTTSYDVVQCAPGGACWASGDAGAVATLVRGPGVLPN